MANPLKILTHLSASEAAEFSKAVTFKSNVVMSNTKITGLAAGTQNGEAVRYEQLSSVDTRISAENSSRILGDNSLSDKIGVEESLRVVADSSLTSRLSLEETNREAAVSSEASLRLSADTSLGLRITAEDSARVSADTSLSGKLDAEVSNRASADTSLTNKISSEESERTRVISVESSIRASADVVLTARISAEESASLSVDVSLSGRITDEVSNRVSGDASIVTAYTAADTSLTNRISSETSARESAITAANTSIDARVSAEVSNRASADVVLTSRVSAEESARASADGSLATAFAAADESLVSRISSEESARASADTSIVTVLTAETSARTSADTSLSTALSAEASARTAEDLLFLMLDGTRAMTGHLDMGGKSIVSANSGAFSGNVTVGGNLTVQGALTYLESTNTQVKDNQIELNYAATPVSNADAGIVIKGSAANKDVKLLVDADGGNLVVNTMVSASALKASGNGELGGTLVVKGQAAVSASLMISGASFGDADASFGYANSMYNVDSAIRFLAGRSTGTADRYTNLRHVEEASLVGGSLNFALPQRAEFASSELGKVMVDVLVASGGGWSNDLIAVKLETTGSYLRVVIDAPAHQDGAVRIIAVNEGLGLESE